MSFLRKPLALILALLMALGTVPAAALPARAEETVSPAEPASEPTQASSVPEETPALTLPDLFLPEEPETEPSVPETTELETVPPAGFLEEEAAAESAAAEEADPELLLDQPVTVTLTEDADAACYRFLPPARDVYIFQADTADTVRITLYNSDMTAIVEDNVGSSCRLSAMLEAGTEYCVETHFDDYSLGSYGLSVSACPILTAGAPCSVTIAQEGTEAIFRFDVPEDNIYTFRVESGEDTELALYDSNLASLESDWGTQYGFTRFLREGEVCYLYTYYSDAQALGTYALEILPVPDLTAQTPAEITIDEPYGSEFVRFVAPESGIFNFSATSDSETWLYLYNSGMVLNEDFRGSISLNAGECCYLETGFTDETKTGSYSLRVQSAPRLTEDTSAKIYFQDAYSEVLLQFTPSRETFYTFSFSASFETWYTLYNSSMEAVDDTDAPLQAGTTYYLNVGVQDSESSGSCTVSVKAIPDMTVGKTSSGKVTAGGSAMFRFQAPADDIYTFTSTTSGAWFQVFDRNMDTLNSSELLREGDICYVEVGFENEEKSGTVYIKTAGCPTLTIGKSASISITEAGSSAWLRFVAPEENMYLFRTGTSGAWVCAYTSDMDRADSAIVAEGDVLFVEALFDDSEKTGSISVSARAIPALRLGESVSSDIPEDSYSAWFRFVAPEENVYSFRTTTDGAYISEVVDLRWDWRKDTVAQAGDILYVQAAFEDEPGDSLTVTVQAAPELTLNGSASASVPDADTYAWFRFTPPEDNLYLFQPETAEPVYYGLIDSEMNDAYCYAPLTGGKTYYLYACYEDAYSADPITFAVSGCPDLTLDGSVSASLLPEEYASFRFIAPEDGGYIFRNGSGDNIALEIYDSDLEQLSSGEFPALFPMKGGNTYYLDVFLYDSEVPGSCILTAESCPLFPEDGTALVEFAGPGDITFLQFTAKYDHKYTFLSDWDQQWMWLMDSTGALLEEIWENSGYTYSLTAGETYFAGIRMQDADATGSCLLQYTVLHSFQETVLVPATCYEEGLMERSCPECGLQEEMAIPRTHNFDAGICVDCGTAITETLPVITMDEPVTAVIDTPGQTIRFAFSPVYPACYSFSNSFPSTTGVLYTADMEEWDSYRHHGLSWLDSDETYILEVGFEGENTIGIITVEITSDDEVFSYPQLPEDGSVSAELTEAGEELLFRFTPEYDHSYEFTLESDFCATLTITDHRGWSFSRSGYTINETRGLDAGKLYIVSIQSDSGEDTGRCTLDISPRHSLERTVVQEPNCTDTGLALDICRDCGLTQEVILPIRHRYMDGVCTQCGEEYRQVLVIGENLSYAYYMDGGEGTLDRVTYVFTPEYTESYTFSSYPYLGSDYHRGGVDTVGYLYDSRGKLLAWDDNSAIDGVGFEISYTLTAGKEYTIYMDAAEDEISAPTLTVMPNHTFEILDSLPAACWEAGWQTQRCTVCGYQETITLPKSHRMDEGEIIMPATCENGGTKLHTCLDCGYQEERWYYPYIDQTHVLTPEGTCTLCGAQLSASGTTGDLTWTLDAYTRTLTISGEGPMPDYTSYGEEVAPWTGGYVGNIIIEDGITYIGTYAFSDCYQLSSVSLPDTLRSIGALAFEGCSTLERISIPASVEALDMSAFARCAKLTDIRIDENNPAYTADENGLIYSKTGETLYLVPSCISGDFTVPATVVTIASGAFVEHDYDTPLSLVTIPASVQEVCDYAFGDGMGYGTVLRFEGDAPAFGENAFAELNSWNGVTDIVFYPADNTTWTEDILLDYGGSPEWTPYTGGIFASGAEGAISWTLDYEGLLTVSGTGDMPEDMYGWSSWGDHSTLIRNVVIEEGITSICDEAFYGFENLQSVQIADSVTHIGNRSFGSCTNLTSVELPASVTSCGNDVFESCYSLTEVILPEGLAAIPGSMFVYCNALESIRIPDSVTTIGERVFRGCTSLKSVHLPDGITSIGRSMFSGCTSLTEVNIPDTVTSIGAYAFTDCSSLTQILLPEGLRSIGYYAFDNCSGLTQLRIPESVEKIHWGAFAFCTGLTEVDIPDGISYLGGTFWGCSNLKEVHIPDSVSHITYWTFKDCTSLSDVELPTSLEAIGDSAFYGSGVEEVSFLGSAPDFIEDRVTSSWYGSLIEPGTFADITANAYYPAANESWTEDIFQRDLGGDITWIASDFPEKVSRIECDSQTLHPKEKTVLTARLAPGLRDAAVIWTIPEDASACISWTRSADRLTVTAKPVTERYTVTITAHTEETDAPSASITLTILPHAQAVQIRKDGTDVSGASIYFDLNREGSTLPLTAEILPDDALREIRWTSSNESVATVDENGLVTFTGKEGKAKIQATAQDGSKKTAAVTIQAVKVPAPVAEETRITLVGGKSFTLKAYDEATGKALTRKQITWTLAPEYEPFASLSASGKLTARKVLERVPVTVIGTMTANPEVTIEYTVEIFPVTTQLELWQEEAMVNGSTLYLDIRTEDPQLSLTPVLYPADALEAVTWKSSSSKLATVSEDGVVTPVWNGKAGSYNTGTVTITATAGDGSGKKASVKLHLGVPAETVEILTPVSTVLRSGKSLTLSAATQPAKPSVSGVVWTILQGSEYAQISAAGKLKAKTVYEPQEVLVAAASKDGNAVSEPIAITILPKADETLLLRHDGANVTAGTVAVDTLVPGETVSLSAFLTSISEDAGETVPCTVTWKTSNSKVASLSAEEGADVTITLLKTGKATITASAKNSSGKTITAKVTVTGARLAASILIGPKKAGEKLAVASGKSLHLAATVLAADGTAAASKSVVWSVNSAYASISSSGKLTAIKDLTSAQTVTVTAAAKDGSGISGTAEVILRPIAQGVQIYTMEDGRQSFSIDSNAGWWVRSNTALTWDLNKGSSLQLASRVYPYVSEDDMRNADQSVTWRSSSSKIASVDETGLVTIHKSGSVTITATAGDGSGKKVSFKLNVIRTVTELTIGDQTVQAGKSLNLANLVTISPADATNKKLVWTILDGSAYATLSGKGNLKAQKVTDTKTVTIQVRSQDGGASATFTVTILA